MGGKSFIMIAINVAFVVMGASMMGVGIWMSVDDSRANELFNIAAINEDLYWTSVYFMIAVGVVLIIIAFIGMWGAMKPRENRWALWVYIIVIGILIIVQLNIIILTAIFWDSIDSGTEETMAQDLKLLYVNETSTDSFSMSWNDMQVDWECCGSYGYMDYRGSNYETNFQQPVPYTCCVQNKDHQYVDQIKCREEGLIPDLPSGEFLNVKGCYRRYRDFLNEHSIILIAMTICFWVLEIAGVVFAFILVRGRGD